MKREIKFRAWDNKKNKIIFPITISMRNCNIVGYTPLMQYTGLKDKNGKEIYEGDVMKTPITEILGEVFYREGIYFVYYSGMLIDRCKDSEVIGNIHENPELIKH